MSNLLTFPPADSKLNEVFDRDDLSDPAKLPSFRASLYAAERAFASTPKPVSVQCLCMRADGSVWLIRVGPKGGWKRLWNFSRNLRRNAA